MSEIDSNTTEAKIWRLLEAVSTHLRAVSDTQERLAKAQEKSASVQEKIASVQEKSAQRLAALEEKNALKLTALDEENKQRLTALDEEHKKSLTALDEKNAREFAAERKKTEAARRETEAAIKELAAEHKKTEAAQQQTELAQQRTEARLEEVLKELGGIGRTQGDIAEEFFSHNFVHAMQAAGLHINEYDTHVVAPPDHEYDIVGVDRKYVVVAEVKARLKKNHIKDFIRKLPLFLEDFPEYRDKKLYGAVAGMAMRKEDGEYARQNGLFLLTQSDSGAAEARTPAGGATLRDFARS